MILFFDQIEFIENGKTVSVGEYILQINSLDIIEVKCKDTVRNSEPPIKNGYLGDDDEFKTGWYEEIIHFVMEIVTRKETKKIYFCDYYRRSQAISEIAERMQTKNVTDKNNDFYLKKKEAGWDAV